MRKFLPLAAAFAVLAMPVSATATSTAPSGEPGLFDQLFNWIASNYPNIVNRGTS